MRSTLAVLLVLAASPAMAGLPEGPACQIFKAVDGTRIMFASDDTAVIRTPDDKVQACGTVYGGGQDGYERDVELRCGPDLRAPIYGDDATFVNSWDYNGPTMVFRGVTFTRDCN